MIGMGYENLNKTWQNLLFIKMINKPRKRYVPIRSYCPLAFLQDRGPPLSPYK